MTDIYAYTGSSACDLVILGNNIIFSQMEAISCITERSDMDNIYLKTDGIFGVTESSAGVTVILEKIDHISGVTESRPSEDIVYSQIEAISGVTVSSTGDLTIL